MSLTELSARRLLAFLRRPPSPWLRLSELAMYPSVTLRWKR